MGKGMNPKLAAALALYVPGVWYGAKQPFGVSGQHKRTLHASGFLERDRRWATNYNYEAFFRRPTPDRSGEADKTGTGLAEGESGLPEGSSK